MRGSERGAFFEEPQREEKKNKNFKVTWEQSQLNLFGFVTSFTLESVKTLEVKSLHQNLLFSSNKVNISESFDADRLIYRS